MFGVFPDPRVAQARYREEILEKVGPHKELVRAKLEARYPIGKRERRRKKRIVIPNEKAS